MTPIKFPTEKIVTWDRVCKIVQEILPRETLAGHEFHLQVETQGGETRLLMSIIYNGEPLATHLEITQEYAKQISECPSLLTECVKNMLETLKLYKKHTGGVFGSLFGGGLF